MVGILILLYGEIKHIPVLSNALISQTYKKYKVYAIDNKPENPCIELLCRHIPTLKALPSQGNIGFAAGNNLLSREAIKDGCKYLWVLNPDMEPEPKALEHLVNTMESDAYLGMIGPLLLLGGKKDNTRIQLFGGNVNFNTQKKRFFYANKMLKEVSLPSLLFVNMINAGSLMIRTELVKNSYLFEETYFMYNDEIDVARRVKEYGYKIAVNSRARVWHYHDWSAANTTGYNLMYYYMMRNKMLYYRKFKMPIRSVFEIFKQLFLLPVTLRFCIKKTHVSMFKYYYLGLFHGFIGKSGKASIKFS